MVALRYVIAGVLDFPQPTAAPLLTPPRLFPLNSCWLWGQYSTDEGLLNGFVVGADFGDMGGRGIGFDGEAEF
jgi:hypothetical protein